MSMSNNTKTIQIDITEAEVIEAQGGVGGSDQRITVTIPDHYDPALITAADVVNDGQIAWEVR